MILDPSDPTVADWLRRHSQPCPTPPAKVPAQPTRWAAHAEDRQEAQREEWRRHKRASRARKAGPRRRQRERRTRPPMPNGRPRTATSYRAAYQRAWAAAKAARLRATKPYAENTTQTTPYPGNP